MKRGARDGGVNGVEGTGEVDDRCEGREV